MEHKQTSELSDEALVLLHGLLQDLLCRVHLPAPLCAHRVGVMSVSGADNRTDEELGRFQQAVTSSQLHTGGVHRFVALIVPSRGWTENSMYLSDWDRYNIKTTEVYSPSEREASWPCVFSRSKRNPSYSTDLTSSRCWWHLFPVKVWCLGAKTNPET